MQPKILEQMKKIIIKRQLHIKLIIFGLNFNDNVLSNQASLTVSKLVGIQIPVDKIVTEVHQCNDNI